MHKGAVLKLCQAKLYSDAFERSNKLEPPIHRDKSDMTTHMYFFCMGCVSDGAPIPIWQEEINQCLSLSCSGEINFDFQIDEEKLGQAKIVCDWILMLEASPTPAPENNTNRMRANTGEETVANSSGKNRLDVNLSTILNGAIMEVILDSNGASTPGVGRGLFSYGLCCSLVQV